VGSWSWGGSKRGEDVDVAAAGSIVGGMYGRLVDEARASCGFCLVLLEVVVG